MSELFEFAIGRGSSNPLFAVTLRDAAGDPITIPTDATVWLVVAAAVSTPQGQLDLEKQLDVVTDRTTGQVYKRLQDADTKNVNEATYLAQVRVIVSPTETWLYPTRPFAFTVFDPTMAPP